METAKNIGFSTKVLSRDPFFEHQGSMTRFEYGDPDLGRREKCQGALIYKSVASRHPFWPQEELEKVRQRALQAL